MVHNLLRNIFHENHTDNQVWYGIFLFKLAWYEKLCGVSEDKCGFPGKKKRLII